MKSGRKQKLKNQKYQTKKGIKNVLKSDKQFFKLWCKQKGEQFKRSNKKEKLVKKTNKRIKTINFSRGKVERGETTTATFLCVCFLAEESKRQFDKHCDYIHLCISLQVYNKKYHL